ncbi:Pentapeptide_repeats-containing protein [Hexamita inflata]|uniref:Pentapeptide repeats-containing protein n=1 Tax=Hexamita inflata TaxID=28002 RepID=A0AA86PCI8_9EUKA|nr:Pentapeptide repeats-containing protein [Hexamita inflata]
MIVTVLPKLVSKRTIAKIQGKLISLDLYEEFVKQWFEKEEEKMFANNVSTEVSDLQKEYEEYCLKLATKMIDTAKTVVEYTSSDKQNQWKNFFDPNNARTTTIRRGAPLNTSSKFYSFIHKSIQEYFVAKSGLRQVQQLTVKLDDSLNCSFNEHLIVDKGVFGFYCETIQRYPEFKKQLYQLIEMSKTDKRVSTAAANAFTILNVANESFRNKDFRNVNIPGANLSLAMLDGADFTGADLSNVDFQSAWLVNVKFNEANMNNVQFGEMANILMDSQIICAKYSKTQQFIGCSTGDMNIYDDNYTLNDPKVTIIDSANKNIVTVLRDHKDDILSLAFSNDDKYFVSCSQDATINIYTTCNWKLIHTIRHKSFTFIDYSMSGNNIICISGGHLCIYSSDNFSLIHQFSEYIVSSAQYYQDEQYIICGGNNKTIYIFDVIQRKLHKKIKLECSELYSVVLSYDNKYFACACDQQIQIWDFATYNLVTTLNNHSTDVFTLQFSINNEYLVSGDQNGSISLWDVKQFQLVKQIEAGNSVISSLQFTMDGQTLMSGCYDNSVRFWEIDLQPPIKQLPGHRAEILEIAYNSCKQLLASCSVDGTAKIWDCAGSLLNTLYGHSDSVLSVCFSPDGEHLLTTSYDQTARLWQVSGVCVKTYNLSSFALTSSFKNNSEFALGCFDGSVIFMNINAGETSRTQNDGRIERVLFSSDGSLLAFTGQKINLRVVNVETGEIIVNETNLKVKYSYLAFKDSFYICSKRDTINYKTAKKWEQFTDRFENVSEAACKEVFTQYVSDGKYVKIVDKVCIAMFSGSDMIWIKGQHSLNMSRCSINGSKNLSERNQLLITQKMQETE